jgi:UDP-glucose 4-epimerase
MFDELKNKKVLITGGLGFIGSNIAHSLVESGAEVTLLDSMVTAYGANYFNIRNIQDKLAVEFADTRDYLTIERLVKDKDYIIHLAAQVSYIDSRNMPTEDMDINCRSILNILEACRKINTNAKIAFSSSRMVYGKILETPTREHHLTNPLSLYGIHKLTCERYLQHYHQEYGIKSVVFRISNPYGPRQQMKHSKYSIAGWFIRMAMEGKEIQVFGEGSQIRDYIFIDDLADAFIRGLIEEKIECDIFNLGSGNGVSFIDMINTIVDVVGKGDVKKIPWPEDYERLETGDYISDQTKLENFFKIKQSANLRDGIQKTFDFYSKSKEQYW